MSNHRFILDLTVFDPAQLRAAALAHPDRTEETMLDDEGEVDIAACLIMLLDPGTLAGCNLDESSAE